uniref:Uncharacterized protein n=1 Tax=Arundo donax TaxID=35708 RepID=A0A0A9HA37_ARUDO
MRANGPYKKGYLIFFNISLISIHSADMIVLMSNSPTCYVISRTRGSCCILVMR